MKGIDLSLIRFDFDLTFAILLMNADGTVYHRYGTRDPEGAEKRLSMPSLVAALKQTLEDHAAYEKAPSPPATKPGRTVESMWVEARLGKEPNCFHCHMVGQAERELARAAKRWSSEEIWKFPTPDAIGLTLDVDEATRITDVASGSAAAAAGLRAGDRLVRIGDQGIRTQADVQWALDVAAEGAGPLPVRIDRDGTSSPMTLRLKAGWKRVDPYAVSWRNTLWHYLPAPGFGGPALNSEELAALGLPRDGFGFRVNHIVTWGPYPRYGQNAQKAGIQKGDIVIGADGRKDFKSTGHFQAYYRLVKKPGSKLTLQVIRGGKALKITMDVIP